MTIDRHKRHFEYLLVAYTVLVITAIVTFQSYYATYCFSFALIAGFKMGGVAIGILLSSQATRLFINELQQSEV